MCPKSSPKLVKVTKNDYLRGSLKYLTPRFRGKITQVSKIISLFFVALIDSVFEVSFKTLENLARDYTQKAHFVSEIHRIDGCFYGIVCLSPQTFWCSEEGERNRIPMLYGLF